MQHILKKSHYVRSPALECLYNNPTRLRTSIPDTGTHTPGMTLPRRWVWLNCRCRTFSLPPVQMGYGLFCGVWVWRRTNRQPCRPPLSNPSTPHGLHGLAVLDDETIEWLLNTCPDIWTG